MTRRIVGLTMAGLVLAIAGCGADETAGAAAGPTVAGWVTAPVVDSAARDQTSLVLRGRARPGSRIVLRGEDGTAFAVGTGDDGRFVIRMRPPTTETLYVVEIQDGEDAVPSPFRLLVAGDPGGPLAMIGAGSPTRRLDPAAALDVIDSDGRIRVASGRATPGKPISVMVSGGVPIVTTAGKDGRWSLGLGPAFSGATTVVVNGQSYAYPADSSFGDPAAGLVAAGRGVALRLQLSETAQQTSWFPDGSPR